MLTFARNANHFAWFEMKQSTHFFIAITIKDRSIFFFGAHTLTHIANGSCKSSSSSDFKIISIYKVAHLWSSRNIKCRLTTNSVSDITNLFNKYTFWMLKIKILHWTGLLWLDCARRRTVANSNKNMNIMSVLKCFQSAKSWMHTFYWLLRWGEKTAKYHCIPT